jgi:hypothetical protein
MRSSLVALLGALLTLGLASPATAHPFGPPSRARIEADGATVSVQWATAEDDWVALGHHLGVFKVAGAGGHQTGAALLIGSPALRRYVMDHITVTQAGTPCSGWLEPVEDLTAEGLTVEFACPAPIRQVTVGITMLTDLHEAYRTLAAADSGARPGQHAFTGSTAHVVWSFGVAHEERSGGPLGAVAAMLAVAGVAWRRRTRKR